MKMRFFGVSFRAVVVAEAEEHSIGDLLILGTARLINGSLFHLINIIRNGFRAKS
jgi:hypothetical protein